jgi:hypothetical protein
MLQPVNVIQAVQASDSKQYPSLLPLDIWIEIAFCFNDIRHVVKLTSICRPLRSALLQNQRLWSDLDFNVLDRPLERHFPVWDKRSIMRQAEKACMHMSSLLEPY